LDGDHGGERVRFFFEIINLFFHFDENSFRNEPETWDNHHHKETILQPSGAFNEEKSRAAKDGAGKKEEAFEYCVFHGGRKSKIFLCFCQILFFQYCFKRRNFFFDSFATFPIGEVFAEFHLAAEVVDGDDERCGRHERKIADAPDSATKKIVFCRKKSFTKPHFFLDSYGLAGGRAP
jgi:hypothetical protein